MCGCRRCLHATTSRQNSWDSCVNGIFCDVWGWYTHAEALVKITGKVEAHDLYGHWTILVFTPEYVRVAPIILLGQLPV